MSLTPTLTADERSQPTERMPIPRSVWGVGLMMAVMIVGLVEGLALTAPDPRPVEDLRSVLSVRPSAVRDATSLQAAPLPWPHGFAMPSKPESSPAPWESAGQVPVPYALPVSACGTCGVVESVKLMPRTSPVDDAVTMVGRQEPPAQSDGRAPAAHGVAPGRGASVYRVRVRMDDGSLRTLTQRRPPVIGARVVVAGRTLRPAHGESAALLGA